MLTTPVENCLQCELYDLCGEFDDGTCMKQVARQDSHTTRYVILEYKGIKKNVADWARYLGINRSTLIYRLKQVGMNAIKQLYDKIEKEGKQ